MEQPRGGSHRARAPRQSSNRGSAVVVAAARWVCAPAPRQFSSRGPVGVVLCEHTPATKPGLLPLPCERGPVVEQPRGGSHRARAPRQSSSRGPAVVVVAVWWVCAPAPRQFSSRGPVGVVLCEHTPATKPGLLPLPCERGPVVEQPRGGSHRARAPRQSSNRGSAVVVVAARWVCAPAPRQFSSRGPVGVVLCEHTPATKPGLLPLPCERGPVVEQPRGGSHRARAPRQSSSRGPAVVVVAVWWVCAPAPRQFSSRGPVGVVLCEHTPATKPGLLPLPCERGPVVEQPRGGSHRARAPRQSSNRGSAVVVVAARWVCAPAPRQFSSRGPVGVVLCEHTPATKPGLLPLPCERGPVVEQPRGGSHRARAPRQSSSRGPAVVVVAARWVCAPAPRQFSSRGPVGVVLCEHTPATKPGLLPLPCERGPVVEQPRGGSHRARAPRQSSSRGPAVVVVAARWVCAPAPRQFSSRGPVGVVLCEHTPATKPGLLPLPCERGPVVEQPRGGSHRARAPRQSSNRGSAVVVVAARWCGATSTACRTTGARTTKSAALGRISNSLAARRSLGIAGVGSALGVAGVGSARAEPAMQHHLTHRRHSTHGGAHDTARTCVAYGRRTHDKVGGARSTLQLARGSSLARRCRCRLCARRCQSAEPAL